MAYQIKDKDTGAPVIVKGQRVFGSDSFSAEAELKDFNNTERSFTAVASRETPDRMGDVVEVNGWKLNNYRKNPVVQPFHDYRALPVGRSLEEFLKGDKLMFKPQFAPYDKAALMYSLYRDKYVRGFSVGFIPLKSEPIEDEKEDKKKFLFFKPTRFKSQELLEVSVAPVPAHQDALAEIRSLVKKGSLYIPAKYLQYENEPVVEQFGKYLHVHLDDPDNFCGLCIAAVSEQCYVVYGVKRGEDAGVLFNQRFIFAGSPMDSDEQKDLSLAWAKDNALVVDVTVESDGDVRVETDDGARLVKREQYRSDMYEPCTPVLIDVLPRSESAFKPVDGQPEGGGSKSSCSTTPSGEDAGCVEEQGEITEEVWEQLEADPNTTELAVDEVLGKPYPNEHACRMNDPGKYTRFRRSNCYRKHDGKCIDFIFGRKSDGTTDIQAMRYPKSVWTTEDARAHCTGKGGTFEAAAKEQDPVAMALEAINTKLVHIDEQLNTVNMEITNVTERIVVLETGPEPSTADITDDEDADIEIMNDLSPVDADAEAEAVLDIEDDSIETRTPDASVVNDDVEIEEDVTVDDLRDAVKTAFKGALGIVS